MLWLVGSGGALRRRRRRRRGGLRLQRRIDPALMHAGAQALRGLRIDRPLAHDTTEGRLDMSARTPETIVEVDVAERRIEVVAPQQVDDAAAEPDAFGIAGRAVGD